MDQVVIAGNPAKNVGDSKNVDPVFKDCVGSEPAKLERSVAGQMGLR